MSKPPTPVRAVNPTLKNDTVGTSHGSLSTYATGYILSIALTVEAYLLVVNQTFSPSVIVTTILLLAVVQLLVQVFYFLHLDKAIRTPWNIVFFLFMTTVVIIVVFGSLWIMRHLDYNMRHQDQSPAEINHRILHDEGISKEL